MTKILVISEGILINTKRELELATIKCIWETKWYNIAEKLMRSNKNDQYEMLREFINALEKHNVIPPEATYEANANYIKSTFTIEDFEVVDD